MKKLTDNQLTIFNRPVTFYGYDNRRYYILHGAGDHRSAYALVERGFGRTASLQPHDEMFLILEDKYFFNHVTQQIETK